MQNGLKGVDLNRHQPLPQSGRVGFLNLISEQGVERLYYPFRWPALYNLSNLFGEANGDELL